MSLQIFYKSQPETIIHHVVSGYEDMGVLYYMVENETDYRSLNISEIWWYRFHASPVWK